MSRPRAVTSLRALVAERQAIPLEVRLAAFRGASADVAAAAVEVPAELTGEVVLTVAPRNDGADASPNRGRS